jgi:hypothetical protein
VVYTVVDELREGFIPRWGGQGESSFVRFLLRVEGFPISFSGFALRKP